MAEGKSERLWDHTAAVIATIAEVNRDRKKRSRPYTPAEFHPHVKQKRKGRTISVEDLTRQILLIQESKYPGGATGAG
jgi:hypothetical protein